MRYWFLPIFLFLLVPFAGAEDLASPQLQMTQTIDELVRIVEANRGDEKTQERRQKMRAVITPHFDFDEMSKRSLGAKWKEINSQQRTEFVNLFSELLATTYLKRIENVENGMVDVKSEKIQAPRALVKTTVNYKGDIFPIDYKLLKGDSTWKVYDVIIENIGLVANYRNEFAGIIRKDGFEGFLDRLRKKAEAEASS
ncbi:MAG: ABC transporter substrate-binding protein [Bdellovibrionales bacterium]|nr:ABC transporter substrate-binding protein [Bdellovibrionales bacterium]